jgi:general secretion pathway protein J
LHARLHCGFTLIELLVAIAAMALLALMSWRGIDGMSRAQHYTQARADEVLTLQTGLAQWRADLDAIAETSAITSLDWNGQVLRITRHSSAPTSAGLRVVAWTRRADATSQWLRWQSPPLETVQAWDQAWAQAERWAQNPSDADKKREVAVLPLQEWQLFYFRNDAWSNPLSSSGSTPNGTATAATPSSLPDGVRAVLTLPANAALSGRLTLDWVNPTVGGGKS